ncbi:hypothetical protein JD844_023633 [Phrynosoma platyrhinos]|uniref:Uncharacterized protein n=1 Tax=Phrynosoma platyrhinos TaxID=52577 RepID=A0ABQ7SX40_PHRPL|nr:hypothetical protein JD844_023633 [Phrynosoma platyrhinos]
MLLPLVLALHLISLIPGRSWCYWQEPHDDSHLWYPSLQMGERFEDHIKTINILLQNLNSWVEEHMGAVDLFVSSHVKNLWEWLEEHTKDLNVWVNMYLWALQEFHNRYLKDLDYKLGREILFHEKCWDEDISKAEMWLEHPNLTMYKWMDEPSLLLYSNVKSSLQEYTETHLLHLEDHVKTLEQLLDNYTGATSKWLDKHAIYKEMTSQDLAWNLLSLDPQAEGRGHVIALQRKCFSVITWLGKHVVTLEEWLWS